MSLKVKKQQFLSLLVLFFVFYIVNTFLSLIKGFSFLLMVKMLALVAIGVITYICVQVFYINYRIDGYLVFMLMSFVFMFGQHLLILIGLYPQNMALLNGKISNDAIFKTSNVILNCFLSMHAGYILTGKSRRRMLELPDKLQNIESRANLMRVGKIVFAVVLIPTLITLISNIYFTLTLGYGERIITGAYSSSLLLRVSSLLEAFMVPALLAMFIAKNNEERWPLFLIIVYIVLYLISGSRIRAFILLAEVFYTYIRVHKRMSKSLFIKLLIVIIIAIVIFGLISSLRTALDRGNSFLKSLEKVIEDAKVNNPIINSISEVGYTFMSTAIVVEKCPKFVEHLNGKSYISAVAYILPNFVTGNYFAKVPGVDDTFKKYLAYGDSGIGSSYIAEAYFNFGVGIYLVMVLYGFMLGKLSEKIEEYIFKGDYLKLFLYIGIFGIIIFYVRSDTRTFFRNFIWFYLSIYMVAKLILNKRKKRS